MIIYDLRCTHGHKFEGWFKTSDDYGSQIDKGMLSCPQCGTSEVAKLPTASRLKRHSSSIKESPRDAENAKRLLLQEIHEYVNHNYVDVGSEFPEQARKIHYGEIEAVSIRGSATTEEAMDLREEGVDVVALPPAPVQKNKLN